MNCLRGFSSSRIIGPLLLAGLLFSTNANAKYITFESTKLLKSPGLYSEDVFLRNSGTYQVTLTDFRLAGNVGNVGFDVTSGDSVKGEIGPMNEQVRSISFDGDAGLYHLNFDIGLNTYGLVGITIEDLQAAPVTTVPLPSSVLLLLSAVFALFGALIPKNRGNSKLLNV